MSKFIIQVHSSGDIGPDYNWDESYAGRETIYFDTREEAEAGIQELRDCGPDFAAADWRVVEIENN